MPRISVIIPCYNDDRLRLCLDALGRQTLPADRFDVIVVDNGSDEPQEQLVESYPFARFASESTPGSYAARNTALRIATGDVLAFTDSDCVPEPDWLENALQRIDRTDQPVVLGGRVDVAAKEPGRPNSFELVDIAFAFNQERTIREASYIVTANLVAPRSVFDHIGVFDQDLLSGADGEWSQRAAAAGYPVLYAEDAAVVHPARATLRELWTKQRRTMAGRVTLRTKKDASKTSLLAAAWRRLTPDIGRIADGRQRLGSRGYHGMAWVRMAMVVLGMQYASLVEYARLKLGGTAERR